MDCTQTCIVLLLKKQIRYVMHLFLHGSVCHCQYKTTLTSLLLVSLLLFCRQKQLITRLQMEGKLIEKNYELMHQITNLKQQEIEQLWAKLGYV